MHRLAAAALGDLPFGGREGFEARLGEDTRKGLGPYPSRCSSGDVRDRRVTDPRGSRNLPQGHPGPDHLVDSARRRRRIDGSRLGLHSPRACASPAGAIADLSTAEAVESFRAAVIPAALQIAGDRAVPNDPIRVTWTRAPCTRSGLALDACRRSALGTLCGAVTAGPIAADRLIRRHSRERVVRSMSRARFDACQEQARPVIRTSTSRPATLPVALNCSMAGRRFAFQRHLSLPIRS